MARLTCNAEPQTMPQVSEQTTVKKRKEVSLPASFFIVLHGNKTSGSTSSLQAKSLIADFPPFSSMIAISDAFSYRAIPLNRGRRPQRGCHISSGVFSLWMPDLWGRKGEWTIKKLELTSIFHQYCLGFIQPGFITDSMHFTQAPFMARRCIHFVFQPNKTRLIHRATKTKMDGSHLPC